MKKIIAVLVVLAGIGAGRLYAATRQNQKLGLVDLSTPTVTGSLGLWNRTAAQIATLQSDATGQVVFCTDCGANGTVGTICVSTGGFVGNTKLSQFVLSTGTVCK